MRSDALAVRPTTGSYNNAVGHAALSAPDHRLVHRNAVDRTRRPTPYDDRLRPTTRSGKPRCTP